MLLFFNKIFSITNREVIAQKAPAIKALRTSLQDRQACAEGACAAILPTSGVFRSGRYRDAAFKIALRPNDLRAAANDARRCCLKATTKIILEISDREDDSDFACAILRRPHANAPDE